MLLRNVTILLGICLCLASNLYAQNFYYTKNEKVELSISTQKILVKFKDETSPNFQKQILSDYKEFIDLEKITILPAPQLTILKLKNTTSIENVNTLLQNIKTNETVEYANYFLAHPDGTLHGISNQILLKLKSDDQLILLDRIFDEMQGVVSYKRNTFDNLLFEIKVNKQRNALTLANELHELGIFEYAEPDFLRLMKRMNTNDPNVNNQWSLNNDGVNTAQYGGVAGADMNVFDAWSTTTGGDDIKVAIIDEGVDLSHPDLIGNLLPGFDATGQGSAGDASGDDAHGTACAGIVAAVGNNNLGGAGIAYNSKIIPIRIAYSSGTDWVTFNSWIANGMNWAWQTGEADILSNSWGGGGSSSSINDAIDNALSNGRNGLGAPVFFAAGNDNSSVSYPATYEPTIAVIAMSMCNQRKSPSSCDGESWWGSNFGFGADIAAPGVKIFTTDISGTNGYVNGDYNNTFNGTSSACPNAAGVMALLLSHNNTLTADEARFQLESTADKVGNYNYANNINGQPNGSWSSELGYGKINAVAALGGTNPPPPNATNDAGITAINEPSGSITYTNTNPEVVLRNYGTNTLTFVTITYNIDGGSNMTYDWIGSLASASTANVTLPNISFSTGNHTFNVATNNPNGQTDDNPSNDAYSNSFSVGNTTTPLTVGIVGGENVSCFGASDGWITVAAGGGLGSYTYNWSHGATGATVSNLTAGIYEVTASDGVSSISTSITVVQPSEIVINITTSNPTGGNNNGTAFATASGGNGGFAFEWSNGITGALIDDLSVGSYTVTVTDDENCTATETVFLTDLSAANITIEILSLTNVLCSGDQNGSATVTATGGLGNYIYNWSNGATGATANDLSADTYTVTATDGVSSTSYNITITEPDPLTIHLTSANATTGNNGTATATAQGGTLGYTYLWNDGSTNPTITNLLPGTYTVTVTDTNSCTAIGSIEILDNQPPSIGYCTSQGNDASYEWINFVRFADINNYSGNDEGYGDYTHIVAELEQGSMHSLIMEAGFSGSAYQEYWKVWIDFNQDGDFEDVGEEVFRGGPSASLMYGNVFIPDGTPIGMTRMRVSMQWNGMPTSCGTFPFGEVEDYAVFIAAPSGGTTQCSEVVVDKEDFENGWGIWNDGGSDCRRSSNDSPYAYSGNYTVRLRDNSNSSKMTTTNLNLESFEEVTVDFTYITRNMTNSTDDFWLQMSRDGGQTYTTIEEWNYGDEFFNGERYFDEVTIEGPFTANTKFRFRCDAVNNQDRVYFDDIIISGCALPSPTNIIANNNQESEETETIKTPLLSHVKLFPNPSSEYLNISFYAPEEMEVQLMIFDMSGRVIEIQNMTLENDKQEIQIDVTSYESGIYMMSLVGEKGRVVEKFTVVR